MTMDLQHNAPPSRNVESRVSNDIWLPDVVDIQCAKGRYGPLLQAEMLLLCRSLVSLFPKAEPDVTAAKAAASSPNAAPLAQEAAVNGTSPN